MNIKDLKDNIRNILIIRRNNIGDMICAIPVLKTLRKELPQTHITVLADSTNAVTVEGASFIDKLIVYKKSHGLFRNKYINYWKTFRENKTKYDIAIVLKVGFSSTSALITIISGARIRMGCIPEKWHPLQYCYNLPLKVHESWKPLHIKDAFLEMIKSIGIEDPVKDISIEIASESRERVNRFFKENNIQEANNMIVFNISNNRPEGTWAIERFKETENVLSKHYKTTYIITSAPYDKAKAIGLSKEINSSFYFETPKVMDFAALVAQSDLLICGEGGAMHIGASVHTPTISLWGKYGSVVNWMHFNKKQFMIKKGEHVNNISALDILDVIRENKLLKNQ